MYSEYPFDANAPLTQTCGVGNVTIHVDCNDRQVICNDRRWGQRAQGQEMECGTEHPTRYLPTLRLSIFDLGGFHHALRERNMFVTRQSVIVPPVITRVAESIDQGMDGGHRGGERESGEIDLGGEDLVVTSMEVCQDTRSGIYDHEMVKDAEQTTGGHLREVFKVLDNHHLAVDDVDTTYEDAETIYNEDGV